MPLIDVDTAIENLGRGQLVAIPTETVYGLAARIDRNDSLGEIFRAKQRPFFDPLIVHVVDVDQAKHLALEWSDPCDALTAAFWPGPLTLLVRKTTAVSNLITAGLDRVGLRCPDHPLALAVLRGLDVALAAPSANRFKQTSPTQAHHVSEEFGECMAILDGGPCRVGVESTVLAMVESPDHGWDVQLLRPGGISRDAIEQVLRRANIKYRLVRAKSAAAPGQLKAHYRPKNPLVLAPFDLNQNSLRDQITRHLAIDIVHELELPSEPTLAARILFAEFRRLSRYPGAIVLRTPQDFSTPPWEAVLDRCERAASLDLRPNLGL